MSWGRIPDDGPVSSWSLLAEEWLKMIFETSMGPRMLGSLPHAAGLKD